MHNTQYSQQTVGPSRRESSCLYDSNYYLTFQLASLHILNNLYVVVATQCIVFERRVFFPHDLEQLIRFRVLTAQAALICFFPTPSRERSG